MARTPRFGRLPRTAPDLSGAIVAMMREFEAQRQQNIVDAWKSGGSFEGKKVTDGMLLKFFDDKLNGLDPADPLYDEAKNTRLQYRFAVDNSKMELRYAEGSVSDAGMSSFYRREAGKHPPNSEIHRSLMKLAAQYKTRAAAGGRGGGGRGRSNKAERDRRIETPKGRELAFQFITDTLLDLARRQGIVNSGQSMETATETTGEGFGDLQLWQGDFGQTVNLINQFATSTDPGMVAYRDQLTAFIRKYDPSFDGKYDLQSILALRSDAARQLNSRLVDAQQNGTKEQVKRLTKQSTLLVKAGSALGVLDPMAEAEEHRKVWSAIVMDPKSTPIDIYVATQEYSKQLTGIYELVDGMAAQAAGSDGGWLSVHAGRMLTELKALNGDSSNLGITNWEESRAHIAGVKESNSDAADIAESIRINNAVVEKLLTSNPNDPTQTYVIARGDVNGNPTDDPSAALTAVRLSDLQATGAHFVFDPSSSEPINVNGQLIPTTSILTAVQGVPLSVVQGAAADASGRPTAALAAKAGTRPDIGAVFTYPDGDVVYMYYDGQGRQRYTYDNPMAEGIVERRTAKGIEWVLPPSTDPKVKDFDPLTGLDADYRDNSHLMIGAVFTSATVAREAGKVAAGEPQSARNEVAAALLAEVGGNELAYAERWAQYTEMQRTQAADQRDRENLLSTRGRIAAGLSPDERDELQRESRVRGLYTLGEYFTGQSGAPRDQAKVLSDALRRATANGMAEGVVAADAFSRTGWKPQQAEPQEPPPVVTGPVQGVPVVNAATGFIIGQSQPFTSQRTAYITKPSTPKPPAPTAPGPKPPAPAVPSPAAPKPPPAPSPTVNPYTGFVTPPPPKPPSTPNVNPYTGFVVPEAPKPPTVNPYTGFVTG